MATKTFWEKLNDSVTAVKAVWQAQDWAKGTDIDPFYAHLDDEDKERVKQYDLLWRYYRGQHREFLTTSAGKPNDNAILNFCRPIVDRGIAFLFGPGVEWELVEGEQTPAEDAIMKAWRSNEWRDAFLTDLALNGAITGTAYVMVEQKQPGTVPRLVNLNPSIVFPQWDGDDIDKVVNWQLRYRGREGVTRKIITLQDSELNWEYWTERYNDGGRWEEIENTRGLWAHSWSPIVHCKNLPNPNEFYGLSDLEDADMNDAINITASFIKRTGRLFPHPILYGYGVKGDTFDTASLYEMSTPEGFMNAVPMQSAIGESLGFMQTLVNYWHMVAGVPSFDPAVMSMGAQSGFALKVLYGPLLGKTQVKRAHYGQLLIELNRAVAELQGFGKENIVTLNWGDPLPTNAQEAVMRDQFEMGAGLVSKETVAARRGIDYQNEAERLAMQQQQETEYNQILLEQARRAFDGGQNGTGDEGDVVLERAMARKALERGGLV